MSRMRKQIVIWTLSCVLCVLPLARTADAQAAAPCVLGYTVGFFNGVWNTQLEAMDGRNALQAAFREASGNADDTYNHEDVSYELFYNHTGSTVGASKLQDVAEVFIQRANELDPSGAFSANGFYLFWESLNGQSTFTNVVFAGIPSLTTFFSQLLDTTVVSAAASLSSLFSSPPTLSDYAAQQAILDTYAAAGRKFVLVAHSQGNLFINQAYDHVQPEVGSTRVKAVHIAPASPSLRGQWILSTNDLVINALRLDGGYSSVVDNNITIPFSSSDASGHTIVGTYLDASRNGRAQVELLLTNAFSALQTGSCPVKLSPSASNVAPGATVGFTAALNPPPDDTALNTEYAWSISGGAGGMFSTANGMVTTTDTETPNVTYIASPTAPPGAMDNITVTAYVATSVNSVVNAEQVGTASSTVTIQSGGLQNGDFSQGLTYWNVVGGGSWIIDNSISYGCSATQAGTQFVLAGVYGTDGSLEQSFTVPANATTLSLYTWNNLDPVIVTVSMIYNGQETVFTPANYEPPAAQYLTDPSNYYSVACTGFPPAFLQYPIQQFDGEAVTLRLRATYVGGVNGTYGNFSLVSVQ